MVNGYDAQLHPGGGPHAGKAHAPAEDRHVAVEGPVMKRAHRQRHRPDRQRALRRERPHRQQAADCARDEHDERCERRLSSMPHADRGVGTLGGHAATIGASLAHSAEHARSVGATALRRAPCRDCASGVQRIYIYNCTGNARFDAGLTNPDGTTRPA